MNSKKTILIYKNENGWMARFPDPEVKADFGTSDIPTPFTPTAESEMVIALLKKRNPGYDVREADEMEWKESSLLSK